MPRPRKKDRSTRGKGRCGTPFCSEVRAPGHFLCSEHVTLILEIKAEFEAEDEKPRKSIKPISELAGNNA